MKALTVFKDVKDLEDNCQHKSKRNILYIYALQFSKFRYKFIACILYYAMHVDLSLTTHYYNEFLYIFLYDLADIEIRIEVFTTISIRIKM